MSREVWPGVMLPGGDDQRLVNCVHCGKQILYSDDPEKSEAFEVHGYADVYHCEECWEKFGCHDC